MAGASCAEPTGLALCDRSRSGSDGRGLFIGQAFFAFFFLPEKKNGGSGVQPRHNQHWRKRSDFFYVIWWKSMCASRFGVTTQSGCIKTVWLHIPQVRWVADGGRLLRGGQ
jgi:hypothetical protein